MTTALVSPSEPKELVEGLEAIVSPLCEEKGADILLYTNHGLLGIQRKEVPHDFISSFTDGRMARELSLLTQSCTHTRLVCEGRFRYWPDQIVDMGMTKKGRIPSRFSKKHVRGMLNDVGFVRGVLVEWTEDISDTILYIKSIQSFLAGEKHLGLYARPSASGTWGVPTAKDIELWILQSFPGIGPAIADSIISRLGGIPLRWTCTFEELCATPKLRRKRAEEMWQVLGGELEPTKLTDTFGELRRRLQSE